MATDNSSKNAPAQVIGLKKPDFLNQSRFGRPLGFRGPQPGARPNVKQVRVTQHKGGS